MSAIFNMVSATEAVGGTLLGENVEVDSVCFDSREVTQGSLFFALKGTQADGHDFVKDAASRGAVSVVAKDGSNLRAKSVCYVPDTYVALQSLARWYRLRVTARTIGVTGSTGKTSTKEMIYAGLRKMIPVHKSDGNYNTTTGIAVSLFDLREEHRASVIEMAMRGPGQIEEICEMVLPSIGVITNIGLSHVGELGSRRAIADAKGELLECLPVGGTAVLNADDEMTTYLRSKAKCDVLTFGHEGDVRVVCCEPTEMGSEIVFSAFGRRVGAELKVPGAHQAVNAAGALAVVGAMGLDVETAAEGLSVAEFPPNRMQVVRFGEVRVLADMYNAAPDSMAAALETLRSMPAQRRVAVLGSMLELGEYAQSEHERIGRLVADLGIDVLGVVGTEADWIAEAALHASKPMEGATRFQTTEAVAEWLPQITRPGDLILIKGSRALRLERLLDTLKAEAAQC